MMDPELKARPTSPRYPWLWGLKPQLFLCSFIVLLGAVEGSWAQDGERTEKKSVSHLHAFCAEALKLQSLAVEESEPDGKDIQTSIDRSVIENLAKLWNQMRVVGFAGQLMLTPFNRLAQVDESVEIVGGWWASQKGQAEIIAKRLLHFDHWMMSKGFHRPERTWLIMSFPSLLNSKQGVVSAPFPIRNIFDSHPPEQFLSVKAAAGRGRRLSDLNRLLHERVRALLFSTYPRSAFVLENKLMQEVITDLGAALYLDRTDEETVFFRSAQRASDELGGVSNLEEMSELETRRTDLLKIRETPVHPLSPSQTMSSALFLLLWELKDQVGNEFFEFLYKPLIDGLNANRKSYLDMMAFYNLASTDQALNFYGHIQYLFATLLKVSRDKWSEKTQELKQDLEGLIRRYELDLDLNKVDSLSRYLHHEDAVNQDSLNRNQYLLQVRDDPYSR